MSRDRLPLLLLLLTAACPVGDDADDVDTDPDADTDPTGDSDGPVDSDDGEDTDADDTDETDDTEVPVEPASFLLIVATDNYQLLTFPLDVAGEDATPLTLVYGEATMLDEPWGIDFVPSTQEIAVTNYDVSVDYFPVGAVGDVAPARTLTGPVDALDLASGVEHDPETDEIFVCSEAGFVAVFDLADVGTVAPKRVLTGPATGLEGCDGVILREDTDEIYVLDGVSSSIRIFPKDADGDVEPTRTIYASELDYPDRGVIVAEHHELIVADEGSSSVLTFDLDDDGWDVSPKREVEGAATGLDSPSDVAWIPGSDELVVADRQTSRLFVWNRTDDGNVAPRRRIGAIGMDYPMSLVVVP